ncbi:SusD/RagB family nutrient-binding outer membrane lipoprotein [Solitalea longa]|uniref:SusD/RagB family nutrient-binding outer membrane lipoprotein n=1 Tax=Solitalea longa TaxID=2079460 RepID=A0A2S5A035_9SPHI|nr:SusD/RagB family nutrient-binding outer membrane lipoprotein [Solitalea longa]POY35679.1 SusD/RagB family nutrient-binding outer membrane lipoprotein [Solitalea longa]
MKKRLIYAFCGVLTCAITLQSCEKFLDINKNPNAAENVDPKLLFSYASTSYINLRSSGDLYIPMALGGQSITTGGNNPTGWGIPSEEQYQFSTFSYGNTWRAYYTSVGANLKQAISLAESATPKNNNAAAQCKVLLALVVYEATTVYGDVPFTEAWNTGISYPKFDAQQTVLNGSIALIDEALAQFDDASALKISDYDMFFKGDLAKWKRLAKSVKLRTLMTMVDKDPTKATQIGQMVTEGGLVSSAADNFKVGYQAVTGKKNPKFAINEQYNGGRNFFFGSKYVVDFMRNLSDPRLPKFFTKPVEATDYFGIEPGADGDDKHDVRISNTLQAADAPEVIFTYQEELFYEAEIYTRGLGVGADLTKASTLYKKAVEESCKFNGVDGTTASTFANGLPNLSTVPAPMALINMHHWVDKMDRGLDAFTQWRRSGPEGQEIPNLSLPIGAPAGKLFRRYEYPTTNEISSNPNAPKELVKYNEKMWFDL